MARVRNEKGQFLTTHNGRKTRLYGIWCGMKERCNNPHNKRYERYGGRGIKVCDEWSENFANFRSWSESNGYEEGLTIDRKDNDGNYEPGNCRWVTRSVQNRNYSRNHIIEYQGKKHCIKEWSEITGITSATILWRLQSGKTLDEVFEKIDRRTTRWQRN